MEALECRFASTLDEKHFTADVAEDHCVKEVIKPRFLPFRDEHFNH